jgi:SAM-dependent methyltransferase
MNAESFTFADRSFDLVVSTENFEHLGDQRTNLREMSRVLTDDGMLLLATPNPEMFLGINNPFHTHEFSYKELLEVVGEFFCDCLISENLLAPPTEEGRLLRENRRESGTQGVNLAVNPVLWGQQIDTTWLSNTHSFLCFARTPRRDVT